MEMQFGVDAEREFARARDALAEENCVVALAHLEKALKVVDNPSWYSYLGYCIAKERGQVRKGIELCLVALEREQGNADHYLNLGKVHLVAKNKEESLRVLREGMAMGGSTEIDRMLGELGMRKPPPFPFLARNHPLNRYIGLILSRLGLR